MSFLTTSHYLPFFKWDLHATDARDADAYGDDHVLLVLPFLKWAHKAMLERKWLQHAFQKYLLPKAENFIEMKICVNQPKVTSGRLCRHQNQIIISAEKNFKDTPLIALLLSF